MKHKNSTKRTLALSLLVMLLCVAMLVGTTFAWFTDSATSSGNKIQAGTLNINLLVKNASGEYESVKDSQAAIFNYDKWEPGYTEVKNVMVSTEGNLALKYTLSIVPKSSTTPADLKLAEVIDVYYASSEVNVENRDLTGLTRIGTLKDVLNGAEGTIINDTLIPDQNTEDYATIVLKMQESAGNDYQGLSVGDGFDLNLVATQYTYEEDSFDDQYDANAQYPYPVSTDAELAEAIATVTPGSVITLTPGTFALPTTSIGEGVTIAGDGADKTTVNVPATPSGNDKTGLVVDKNNVTISNVTISGNPEITSDEYYGVIDIREGGTTLDNVSISRSSSNASCVVIKGGVNSGETVTLKNSTLKGGFKTIDIVDGANGTVIIDNCDITGIYTFNVNSASSQDLTIKVTDSKLHGWTSYGSIKEAIFTNTEFSKGSSGYDFLRPYADTTLTNCTFDSEFTIGSGDTGFTITLNNCVKGGVAVTADNVQSLLLDMTGSDGTKLRGCTIIVNGTTATLS